MVAPELARAQLIKNGDHEFHLCNSDIFASAPFFSELKPLSLNAAMRHQKLDPGLDFHPFGNNQGRPVQPNCWVSLTLGLPCVPNK